VRSDARLLRRILQNLVSNAIRYTAAGKCASAQTARPGTSADQRGDTGPGIPRDQQERIFEEFRRLDHSHRIPGKGLGLAIVRRATAMLQHPLELCPTRAGRLLCRDRTAGESQADTAPAPAKPTRDRAIQGAASW
jgi:K+-sensing histidine kinase KdpD